MEWRLSKPRERKAVDMWLYKWLKRDLRHGRWLYKDRSDGWDQRSSRPSIVCEPSFLLRKPRDCSRNSEAAEGQTAIFHSSGPLIVNRVYEIHIQYA